MECCTVLHKRLLPSHHECNPRCNPKSRFHAKARREILHRFVPKKSEGRRTATGLLRRSAARLGIRVAPSGVKTWFVMRRVNARMTRKTLGRYPELSLSEARIQAGELLTDMAK